MAAEGSERCNISGFEANGYGWPLEARGKIYTYTSPLEPPERNAVSTLILAQ